MWCFIVIWYMYESSKDNIDSYVCGLHLYICVCGFLKLAGWVYWYLADCIYIYIYIYMYVCGFLKLASLSKLIFGRFFLKKEKEKLVGSIYICVCVCVCVCFSFCLFYRLSLLPLSYRTTSKPTKMLL